MGQQEDWISSGGKEDAGEAAHSSRPSREDVVAGGAARGNRRRPAEHSLQTTASNHIRQTKYYEISHIYSRRFL